MMTRTNMYLTEVQLKKFKAIAKKAGYPLAEIIRRAMDEWLQGHEIKQMAGTTNFNALAESFNMIQSMRKEIPGKSKQSKKKEVI